MTPDESKLMSLRLVGLITQRLSKRQIGPLALRIGFEMLVFAFDVRNSDTVPKLLPGYGLGLLKFSLPC